MIRASDILEADILIVDDQEANIAVLEKMLRSAGYSSVESTREPRDVCELHRKNQYSLILLDLLMPGMDGFQVLEGLQAIETEGYLPVLVQTAQPAHKLRALKAGAKDFVSKPFDLAEILMRVHNLLEVRLLNQFAQMRTEQAEASEEELRASELRYRRLFEAAKDGILILDMETGRISDVNPYLTELLGFSREEMIGQTVGELSPFKDIESNKIMLERLQTQGYVRYDDLPLETRDGSKVAVEFVSNVYKVGDKEVIQCNVRDITDRKQAEVAKQASEARYRTLFDYAPLGIVIADSESTYIDANPGMCRMLGYSREELIGRNASDIVVPGEIQYIAPALGEIKATSAFHREWKFRRKDGSVFDAEVNATMMPDGNLLEMIRDITELKGAEQALRSSEATMAAAQRIAHFGSWELELANAGDVNANQLRWSDEMFRIAGYEPGAVEVSNEWFFRLVPEDEHELIQQTVATAIRERRPYSLVHSLIRLDGERRVVHETAQMFFDEKTNLPIKMVGTAHDITERKRAEAALQESESRYHSLFENMLEGYAHCQALFEGDHLGDFIYLEVNSAFGKLTGLKNVVGRKVSEVIPGIKDANPQLFAIYSRVAMTGQPEKFETYVEILDIWLSITVYSTDREHFVAVFDNITTRKLAEKALRTSEEEFRVLAEAMPQMVWITRPDGWTTYFSQQWMDYTGLTLEESLGHGWNKPFHPEDRQAAWDAWERATTTINTYSVECRLRRADGAYRWWLIRGIPLQDDAGRILKWFGTCTDIHDLKLAEQKISSANQALRESNEKFQLLANNITDAFWIRSSDAREVYYISPAFERIWGRSVESLYAHPEQWSTFILPEDRERVQAAYTSMAGDVPHVDLEYRIARPDGEIRWVHVRGFQVRDDAGKVVRLTGIVTEITERKRAEERIHQMNIDLEQRVAERTAQLQDANKELEAFSYSVSHDLRAPLRHVMGFVELIQRDAGTTFSEKNAKRLTTISQAANRMGLLIDDLLAFSHLGRSEMRTVEVNLDELVRETADEVTAGLKDRKIVWDFHALPPVRADRALLRMVLVNLLSNAVKFTGGRAEARIEIGCAAGGIDETVVFVRDNGAGFNPNYSNKLFGVFQRLHSQSEFEGTGIGLANVQRIIHRHGGRTWAEGVLDGGATFYFSLPNRAETA